MSSVKQIQVTFDCAEPVRVARFWAETLGYRAEYDDEDGSAAAEDPTGSGPRLYFQRVPEDKVVKNRLHLDVRVGTRRHPDGVRPAPETAPMVRHCSGLAGEEKLVALEAECARLIPLGARRVRLLPADEDNESCIVMQDIEGNEFCLD